MAELGTRARTARQTRARMAVTIPSTPALVIGIALNHSRADFSERDRAEATERALWSSRAADLASVTRREHEVLVLLANGQTNPEIADCLSLSPRTVQKLEHIDEKVGVGARTAAAMKLASTGR